MKAFSISREGQRIHFASHLSGTNNIHIIVSDLGIDCTYFDWRMEIPCIDEGGTSFWVDPFSANIWERMRDNPKFPGLRCKILNPFGKVLAWQDFHIGSDPWVPSPLYDTDPFDANGASYVDFFYTDLLDGMDFSGVVVDAGANTGFFTLKALSEGAHRVYLIEPDPSPFFYCHRNFSKNPKVVLVNKGLSSNTGTLDFWVSDIGSVGNSEFNDTTGRRMIRIETVDLPTILALEQKISLLKLDIEGTEYEVLRGLDEGAFAKVNQWFIEFHRGVGDLAGILEARGYKTSLRNCEPQAKAGFIHAWR